MSRTRRTPPASDPATLRRFAALTERGQRTALLDSILREKGDRPLVALLGAALDDHSRTRDTTCAAILLAAMDLLASPGVHRTGLGLVAEARTLGDERLARFLESPPPLLLADLARAEVVKAKDGRPLSLGERKSLARNPGRMQLDRLLADPSPDVMRNLLASPRLTEIDVVRIAARRPAVPAVLAEVARSRRWVMRYRVRLTLVANPHLDPSLGIRLAPHLLSQDRRRLAADSSLHPRLREFLARLLGDPDQEREPPPAVHGRGSFDPPKTTG